MIDAAKEIGSALNQTTMAVMLGNAWNDLVQPFWILPALALSKLKLRDVMGHGDHDAVGGRYPHRRRSPLGYARIDRAPTRFARSQGATYRPAKPDLVVALIGRDSAVWGAASHEVLELKDIGADMSKPRAYFVTGGSAGIGAAIVRMLLDAGHAVVNIDYRLPDAPPAGWVVPGRPDRRGAHEGSGARGDGGV